MMRATTAGVPEPARRLVRLARGGLGGDLAFLATAGDEQRLVVLDGDLDGYGVSAGLSFPMEASLCDAMLAGRVPRVLTDTRAHPIARDVPVVAEYGIGAYVGAPVLADDGHPLGTLCVIAKDPRPRLRGADARFLDAIAQSLGPCLEGARDELDEEPLADDPLDALDTASPSERERVRLAVEVGAHLHVDASGLVALARDSLLGVEAHRLRALEELPLDERIVGAVEAYVGLTSVRPGAVPVGGGEARDVLRRGAGSRWCAISVAALLAVVGSEFAPGGVWLGR